LARQRRFQVHPQVADDIRAIRRQNEKLAIVVLGKLADLRAGRVEGQPLQDLPGTGDLSDCRKIYVGLTAMMPSHRIVYRVKDNGAVEVIEVVVVGEREALAVYLEAIRRLGGQG
jgi:mRNA interferase RelE/StbE